jgi:hypothetical protein
MANASNKNQGSAAAGDALAARTAGPVMRVLLDAGGMRPVLGVGAMAGEAHLTRRLAQLRFVLGAVHIVAAEAGDGAVVHKALDEVIALHAVLMRRRVREMTSHRFAQCCPSQPKVHRRNAIKKVGRTSAVSHYHGAMAAGRI